MCPVCGEPMIILELEGVEIDHCLTCRGTWLDHGELERIAGGASAGEARPASELARKIREARAGKRSGRRCPRCRRRLRPILLGAPAPIEVDRCSRCLGLWLDRGEVEAVVASCRAGEEGAVARFFSELYRKDLEGKFAQREGE